ncbi:MAG: Gfo/Idh/MocA family oxidoreductase, partial [Planctomycetales bacterium]|nr:Gfo/Idh/MocA family oxidoreductase [Planctomycetales bacterium]
MPSKIRIAIIGAGAVADYHHVPGIRIDPRAELVAACDPNETLLAQRQKDWGPIRVTTKFEEIAADPDIDAVIICTPNFTHLPITLACLNAGKHVMCEKPLGLNFAEAHEMYRTARDRGLRHMTAFTYRF